MKPLTLEIFSDYAQTLGITGVPAFVADRKAALSGVQSTEGLRELVEHVRN